MKPQSFIASRIRDRAPALCAQAFVLCGAMALFASCATEPESHVVSAPPPAAPGVPAATFTAASTPVMVTTQTTQTTPTGTIVTTQAQPLNTIVVTQAPPAPQAEVVIAQPSSRHLWIAGYWTWRNNRYEWMAGHWEVPPRSGAAWVTPRWETENGAYRFYEGYWN